MEQQRLSVKEVWLSSLRLYRDTFSQIWFLPALISMLMSFLFVLNKIYPLTDNASVMTKVFYITMILIPQLLNIYLMAMVLHRIKVVNEQQNLPVRDSLLFINKKYFRIFICHLLVHLLVILGLFLLVFPSIYVVVVFWMALPLVLFENKKIFAALKDSYKLVKGNWWYTFIVFLPLPLIFYSVAFLVVLAVTRYAPSAWYLTVGFGVLFTTIFYPLLNACTLVQYNNLKSCAVESEE